MKILMKDELAIQKLPEIRATYYLTDGKSVIFAGLTSNLFARINKFREQRKDDDKVNEMLEKAEDLVYEIQLTDMDSLIWYKTLIKSFTPYYNDYINIWENYSYLAIDWEKAPYLSIKENTQSNHLYLGPFRSRFFISDLLSVMNKYIKLPICPDKPEICEMKETTRCISTCTRGDLKELKTLKDLKIGKCSCGNVKKGQCNDEYCISCRYVRELKQEAIKWVKEYAMCNCENCGECYMKDKWIKFLNLTEEDLEEKEK